jgi:hypothetical protein
MSTSTTTTRYTPPAMITHSVASIRGQQTADVSVHHARTPDARIAITFSGILMVIYGCGAAQRLLEAFAAARGHLNHLPTEIPTVPAGLDEPCARATLSIEWTRRPDYAVVPQSGLNKLKSTRVPWIDLYTGPITWQIRDQLGLLSTIELLGRVHKTAIAVFRDGDEHAADPTRRDYHAA